MRANTPDRFGRCRGPATVVGLVVLGLTSREIAERLGISRRTVETHLGNAYLKADVSDRAGLIDRVHSLV